MRLIPSLQWRIAALLLGVCLSCLLIAGLVVALRPARVRSYNDQIAYALRTQDISYEAITLGDRWPDHINFQYGELVFPYGYQVTVTMRGGRSASGSIECAKLERVCEVTVAELGLRHVDVPDIEPLPDVQLPRWLGRFRPEVEWLLRIVL